MKFLSNYMGQIYLAVAASLWGAVYVVCKVVLDIMEPMELLWWRYLIAIIALFIIGVKFGESWYVKKKDLPLIALIGLIGYSLSIWTQFVGVQLSTAQMGSVITSSAPIFMVIFARFILKERITLRKALSVFIATIGMLLIVGVSSVDSSVQLGALFLVGSSVSWALGSVLIKKVPSSYSIIAITNYAMIVAWIAITPFVLPHINMSHIHILLQPHMIAALFYIAVCSTSIAFMLWNKGMQLVEAGTGGLYLFFQPLVGSFLGWLFLGEQVGIPFLIGTALILLGVLLVIRK